MATMMAIIKESRSKGLSIVEKEVPETLNDHEVLIEVLSASLCGTDVHIYQWDPWAANRLNPPLTVGHEFSGRVVRTGSKVDRVKVDDIVSSETHIVCGQCEFCRTGRGHICQNTQIIGVDRDGCFAEFIRMPESNLIIDKSGVDPKFLSVLEPLGNAVHTMLHFDISCKTVAVVGCGPIGLMGINVAKAVGAKKIIAIEVNPYRMNLARELGADVIINPKETDVIEAVLRETNGLGVDVVAEFSGNKKAIEQSFKYIKKGGCMSLLGIASEKIEIDISTDVVFKGITIYGVTGRKMYENWDQVSALLESKKIRLDKIVTHVISMKDYEEAFRIMASGNSGKVVLIP